MEAESGDERGANALVRSLSFTGSRFSLANRRSRRRIYRFSSPYIFLYSISFGLFFANKTDPSVEVCHVLKMCKKPLFSVIMLSVCHFYRNKDLVLQSQFWASKARTFLETFSRNGSSMKPAKISFDHTKRVFGSMAHLQPTKTDRN